MNGPDLADWNSPEDAAYDEKVREEHAERRRLFGRCRSWRVRAFRIVRCSWPADHVKTSKWHCAEDSTGHVWYVRDRERG